MVSHRHQREADFLAAFLAGGCALFAGVFLLAVLPTIFLIGTFFAPVLAAVLTADLAGALEADLEVPAFEQLAESLLQDFPCQELVVLP